MKDSHDANDLVKFYLLACLGSRDANSNLSSVNANVIPPPPEYAGSTTFAPLQKSESVPNACERVNNKSGQ